MPLRLPVQLSWAAPSALMRRFARPFSSTPISSQPPYSSSSSSSSSSNNPVSNILSLDQEPASRSAEGVRHLVRERAAAQAQAKLTKRRADLAHLRERKTSDDYVKQMPRKWQTGDVYAPQDLHPHQLDKWRKRGQPKDVTDVLNVNPLDMYKNFSMLTEFMTSAGQIKHSKQTGLRPRNQRKMAKAIRRVMGMGIYPSVHHHPELLKKRMRGGRFL